MKRDAADQKFRALCRYPTGSPYLGGAANLSGAFTDATPTSANPTEIGQGVYEWSLTTGDVEQVLAVVTCPAGVVARYDGAIPTIPDSTQIQESAKAALLDVAYEPNP